MGASSRRCGAMGNPSYRKVQAVLDEVLDEVGE
jgi:hypothetical protein